MSLKSFSATSRGIILLLLSLTISSTAYSQAFTSPERKKSASPGKTVTNPVMSIKVDGFLGEKMDLCISHRIKDLDFDQFVEPFRHREETRLWQGEFFGKLMLAAIESYKYNNDPVMLGKISKAFRDFIATQTPDGYIGNYSQAAQLEQWDIWCRKYSLLALLSFNSLTGDKSALDAAIRLADYTITQVGPGKISIVKTGNYRGMPSSSILEPIVLLYKQTGEARFLDFAKYIVKEWETEDGPKLISKALAGIPVAQRFPFPSSWWSYENGMKAYEMMSCYDGLLELYTITRDQAYLKAAEKSAESIIQNEINIAGSGSAFECWYNGARYQTEPAYHMMETCVTFTWMKFCLKLLSITGNPEYADQFERSAYNALPASMRSDGSQIAKYSPLEGLRDEGEKQCGMNINCCNANGPRGFMLIPSFAVSTGNDSLTINLYNSFNATVLTPGKGTMNIALRTDYPATGHIGISIEPSKEVEMNIFLRIPSWSRSNMVAINGISVGKPEAGSYFRLNRKWQKGDLITLNLDPVARVVNLNGCQAIVKGPVVLARDSRFIDGYVDEVALVSSKNDIVELKPVVKNIQGVWLTYEAPLTLGTNLEGSFRTPKQVTFCDFASAGNTWLPDSRYRVWIRKPLNVMKSDYKGY
ncbi:MAG: glycoside hydrolase family 127 protein [Bacteroidales bacterium]